MGRIEFLPLTPQNMVSLVFPVSLSCLILPLRVCAILSSCFIAIAIGRLVFHTRCLAKATGERQMIRLHQASDQDPDFLPLPQSLKQVSSKNGGCTTCTPSDKVIFLHRSLFISI